MGPSSGSAKVRPACSSSPARSAKGRRRSTGSSAPSTCAVSPPVTKRPGGLLARPAPAAAALVGLTLLDEARAACGRLEAPDDAEALHDFRVAARRLRTLLRSFRRELGGAVAKKLQRRCATSHAPPAPGAMRKSNSPGCGVTAPSWADARGL